MATRKPFLFRADPAVLSALKRWAADELRSVNGQIDYLLRRALREAGRLPGPTTPDQRPSDGDSDVSEAGPRSRR